MVLQLGQEWKFTSASGNYFYIVEIIKLKPYTVGLVKQSCGFGDYMPQVDEEKYSLWIDPKGTALQTDEYDGTWELISNK